MQHARTGLVGEREVFVAAELLAEDFPECLREVLPAIVRHGVLRAAHFRVRRAGERGDWAELELHRREQHLVEGRRVRLVAGPLDLEGGIAGLQRRLGQSCGRRQRHRQRDACEDSFHERIDCPRGAGFLHVGAGASGLSKTA